MKNYKVLKDTIENIFRKLHISYRFVDLEDDNDLNYFIKINTKEKLSKGLKEIDAFLYLHEENSSLHFFVFNIYKCDEKDILLNVYEIINIVNRNILMGNFLLEDKNQIIYRNAINCGSDFCALNEHLIKNQIDIFLGGLENLFSKLLEQGL